ncbi:hypothetical protein SVAN01_04767 [Stagonosporopsis vannaccii]|nr:hypothetical protein SVAN01_04767 [Stagonosporopsis vannaccii]
MRCAVDSIFRYAVRSIDRPVRLGDSLCLVLVLVGSLTLEVDGLQNRRDSDFASAKRGGRKALTGNLGEVGPTQRVSSLR